METQPAHPSAAFDRHFTATVLSQVPRLRPLARSFGVDPDDLCQEVALRAWEHRGKWREGNPLAWLRVVAQHIAVSIKRREATEAGYAERVAASRPQPGMPIDERLAVAQMAFVALDVIERDLNPAAALTVAVRFGLADGDSKTAREAAAQVGCKVGTVLSRTHRARAVAREHFSAVA